jgi:predicted transglutaminase-like cysteine proteinase
MRSGWIRLVALAAGLGWALALGCASPTVDAGSRYFGRPDPFDPWSFPIARWQAREQAQGGALESSAKPLPATPLRSRYAAFLAERRRMLARQVTHWVQAESRERYAADGEIDFWPTLDEVLETSHDDCDGLELLAYNALRELGFPRGGLFRAILRHERWSQHHMVTLWFERPDDPWVIDPTATVTTPMRRMSEISHWRPIKVFSESVEYTVASER